MKKRSSKLSEAFTANGTVHPIRDSKGYSMKKAGEKGVRHEHHAMRTDYGHKKKR